MKKIALLLFCAVFSISPSSKNLFRESDKLGLLINCGSVPSIMVNANPFNYLTLEEQVLNEASSPSSCDYSLPYIPHQNKKFAKALPMSNTGNNETSEQMSPTENCTFTKNKKKTQATTTAQNKEFSYKKVTLKIS